MSAPPVPPPYLGPSPPRPPSARPPSVRPPSVRSPAPVAAKPYSSSDWGPRGDGQCHCNGGNCYCDMECFSCLDEEETDKFCVHLDPDAGEKIEIELIRIRKFIRFLATLALLVGSVELGVGTFRFAPSFSLSLPYGSLFLF